MGIVHLVNSVVPCFRGTRQYGRVIRLVFSIRSGIRSGYHDTSVRST